MRDNSVNVDSGTGKDEEEFEADRQATSMKDQLSKEVASWSKERRQQPGEIAAASARPAAQRRSSQPAAEAKKASAAAAPAAKVPGKASKPFSMSYDGVTHAEYARDLQKRGLR
jgi:hypothetical protein